MEHEGLPVLEEDGLCLRPLRRGDVADLLGILRQPGVERWWGPYDEEKVERDFFGQAWTYSFMVLEEYAPVGVVQFHEVPDPDYKSAGVDITLADSCQDRGIGTHALRLLIRYLIRERGHHRITIDPATDNPRAIHVYEKVGFKRVGVMRQYERGIDGRWHDGMLMDLLAEEFEGS